MPTDRMVRSFNLSTAACAALDRIVAAAKTTPAIVTALDLPPIKPAGPNGCRPLSGGEIASLAATLQRPDLVTELAVRRALNDPFINPVLTSEAISDLSFFLASPGQPDVKINTSRVLDAVILKGVAAVESQASTTVAAKVDDGQAGHKSSNRKARKTDAGSSVHRAGSR